MKIQPNDFSTTLEGTNKIKPADIRQYIVRRCNERMKAEQYTNRHPELYEKAREMKYKLGNVLAPMLVCRFLLENLEGVKHIITVVKPYTHGHTAYINKLVMLDELVEYAKSYLMTGGTRGSIDCVIMKKCVPSADGGSSEL